MTERGDEHEAVPDRVLKTQAAPDVEDDAGRIKYTAENEQHERCRRERGRDRAEGEEAAPAHHEIERDRRAVETAWPEYLDRHAGERRKPYYDEQLCRPGGVHRQHESRVGRSDQQVDRRMIETAQP